MNREAEWPYRGASYCVSNATNEPLSVFAEDAAGRRLQVGERKVKPGKQSCFRWPFIHAVGRINIVQGADTSWGPWFEPWPAPPVKK